jgi:hypothetical protein
MDRGRVGEDRGSKETDGCPLTVIDEREWIPILPGDHIQSLVVLDKAKLSIFLLDKEDRSSKGGL